MKKIHSLFIFALLIIPWLSFAQEVKINVTFNTPLIQNNESDGYMSVITDDMLSETEKDLPDIPFRYLRIIIPSANQATSVSVNKLEEQTIHLDRKIQPTQAPIPTGNTNNQNIIINKASVYSLDNPYPEDMAKILSTENFNGNRVVTVKVSPFQYYPTSNILKFYSQMEITLRYKGGTLDKKQSLTLTDGNVKTSFMTNKMLCDFINNKEDFDRFAIKYTETTSSDSINRSTQNRLGYDYVIITSEALAPAFERFANWKRRKGLTVGIVTMEYIKANYTGDLVSGIYDDAGKVRQFLKDSYANGNGTKYVLLGGDENIIPARYACIRKNQNIYDYTIPTDMYYAEFNGNWNVDGDQYYGEYSDDSPSFTQQIYVGRILCSQQTHVDNWTYKALLYEQNPGRGDYAYLRKLFFTQADQMQQANHANYIGSKLTSFTTKTIFNEEVNGVLSHNSDVLPSFPSGSDVIEEFNKNYGFVSFLGHGSTSNVAVATVQLNNNNYSKLRIYTYDHIKADGHGVNEYSNGGALKNMANDGYPNINYSISCDNIPYDKLAISQADRVDDSFGEVITSIYRTGSVAFLGNTRYGWVNPSKLLFGYFADAINSGYLSLGEAEAISKNFLSKTNEYDRYLFFTHNLIGCPEMKIWTTTPSTFYNASVTRSGSSVTVAANKTGSKICVMSSIDNGVSYHKTINTSRYTFTNVPDSYIVTITKENCIPYIYASDVSIVNKTYNTGSYFIYGKNFSLNNVTVSGTTNLYVEPTGTFEATGTLSINENSRLSIE